VKTIIWKSEDITKRSDTARVWRVSAVVVTSPSKPPRAVGSITGSYQSEAQLLMALLQREKILPAKVIESHMPHTLEAAGIARCYHL